MEERTWTFADAIGYKSQYNVLLKQQRRVPGEEFYKFYKARCKARRVTPKDVLNKKQVAEVRKAILRAIREAILNNTGGVLIKGFGYFCIFRYPEKRKKRITTKQSPLIGNEKIWNTGFYRYQPIFTPFNGDSEIKFFAMDFAFHNPFNKELDERLGEGWKYCNYLYTLKPELELSEALKAYRKKITYIKWLKTSKR